MSKLRLQMIIFILCIGAIIFLFLTNRAFVSDFQIHPGIAFFIFIAVAAELGLPEKMLLSISVIVSTFALIILAALLSFLIFPTIPAEALIGFSIWLILAHTVVVMIREYERIEKIARLNGIENQSTDIQSALPRIQADITRSRHYQRPLSVIVINIPRNVGANQKSIWGALFNSLFAGWSNQARMAQIVQRELRAMDLVLIDSTDQKVIIVCPEIKAVDIPEVAQHLETAIYRELGIIPDYASATFPDEAYSFEGLRQVATEKLNRRYKDPEKFLTFDAHPNVERKCKDDVQIFLPATCSSIYEMTRQISWLNRLQTQNSLRPNSTYHIFKRAMDLTVTLAASPFLMAVFLLVAILIKLEDPKGAIFFLQDRTGKNGKRFQMFKFRTMVHNAEALKKDLAHLNELEWPDFKVANDPRITRVGRFLRKTSLDELPQFINILKGEMSLVGPRPTSFKADTYELWQTERLDVVPGLTGLWQILGRSDLEFCERSCLDIIYIERRSLILDTLILINTFTAVLKQRGAY